MTRAAQTLNIIRTAEPNLERQLQALMLVLGRSVAGQKKGAPGVEAWGWNGTAIVQEVTDDTLYDPASTSAIISNR
jgi:hypothetical protein